jgi:GT2 family glycosyltransferase
VTGPAAVVIGRNEGARLARSLRSVVGAAVPVVYVDSGSQDGSPAAAAALGVPVVALDPARPFTAARARNAGIDEVVRRAPGVELVQLVDGDSELLPGWLAAAAAVLARRPAVAAVAGRQREREPGRSPYQRLYQMEWDALHADPHAFGGLVMLRVRAHREVGGFDADLAAGEEADLALRLRDAGWEIVRLDADMAVHDAGMRTLGEWWRRAARTGEAWARLAARYHRHPARLGVRESASTWLWTGAVPLATVGATWAVGAPGLALLAAYPLLWLRIVRRARRRGTPPGDAALYALACVGGKVPQALGQVRALIGRAGR